jgi:hypothetical protein
VVDIAARRYVGSIPELAAVAGALVAGSDLVVTSNRGENTIGVFTTADVPSRQDRGRKPAERTRLRSSTRAAADCRLLHRLDSS